MNNILNVERMFVSVKEIENKKEKGLIDLGKQTSLINQLMRTKNNKIINEQIKIFQTTTFNQHTWPRIRA